MSAGTPALEGDLSRFLATDVLQFLKLAGATGRLEFERAGERIEIGFDHGRPTDGRCSGRSVRLGDVLVHRGVVSESTLASALADQRAGSGVRLGALLRASHGVITAGSAQGLPFGALGGSYDRQSIGIEGGEAPVDAGTAIALRQQVSTEYLAALGVPILAGRTFTREEQDSGAPVGVVNELFVRRFFPGQSGIGRRFDNDIVVDDARVSRAHAQLRLRFAS